MNRAGDEKRYFQTDRTFKANGKLYFSTREGEEVGPLENMNELEWELAIYIRRALLYKPNNMEKVA